VGRNSYEGGKELGSSVLSFNITGFPANLENLDKKFPFFQLGKMFLKSGGSQGI